MSREQLPKSEWSPGPWQDEPDEFNWKDERTGLPCAIKRNPFMGHLCGYVGIPPTHPFFGWDHDDHIPIRPEDMTGSVDDVGVMTMFGYALSGGDKHGTIPLCMTLKVHGGITWSGELPWSDDGRWWWYGFDCGHAGDGLPGLDAVMLRFSHTYPDLKKKWQPLTLQPQWEYRDLDYVKKECASLAFQLRQLETRVLVDAIPTL
jgi:hypothetical protein